VALFVDLRATFDSVDRGELIRTMRERKRERGERRVGGKDGGDVKRNRSRVRIGGQIRQGFWTARGVRQRYPLSPLLFNLLIANMEELRRVK